MLEVLSKVRHSVAAHTLPFLPESVQAKIVGNETTWTRQDLRQVAMPSKDSSVRLLIAPANYAGQGYLWAQAANTLPGVCAQNLQYYDPHRWFRFRADTQVRKNVWGHSTIWKARQLRALSGFTHILIEAGRPIIQREGWALREEDVSDLQNLGLKVGLIWHGSDVRLPSVHRVLEPESPYADSDPHWGASMESIAQANHDLADKMGLPEFVSNPYLRAFRPHATWLPTLSDPNRWDCPVPIRKELPTVLHVPSQTIWKGTENIRAVMRKLEEEGVAQYVEAREVRPEDMPELVASSDIVVDGLRNGPYGVVSLEAMLSRRVAVAHTWESTRADIKRQYGVEVPVVEAVSESFEQVIRDLACNYDKRVSLGESGRDYVLKVHSEEAVAKALEPFLMS